MLVSFRAATRCAVAVLVAISSGPIVIRTLLEVLRNFSVSVCPFIPPENFSALPRASIATPCWSATFPCEISKKPGSRTAIAVRGGSPVPAVTVNDSLGWGLATPDSDSRVAATGPCVTIAVADDVAGEPVPVMLKAHSSTRIR